MKFFNFFYVLAFIVPVLAACAIENKIILHPEGGLNSLALTRRSIPEPPDEDRQVFEIIEIIDFQNKNAGMLIPEWVELFRNGTIHEIEAMNLYKDKYIFIGENSGNNFFGLQQWASSFTVKQDLPRLAAERIEKRMILTASLYPDDEYGDFFEAFIKAAVNAEYPNAAIEDRFWIHKRIHTRAIGAVQDEKPPVERFEFMILISVDKNMMQSKIRAIMDGIKTRVRPTRDQAVSISKIKQTFFERF